MILPTLAAALANRDREPTDEQLVAVVAEVDAAIERVVVALETIARNTTPPIISGTAGPFTVVPGSDGNTFFPATTKG